MAVPKKKTPKSKKGMRRSHHGRFARKLAACPNCKSPMMPHTPCTVCGMYRGRQVLNVAAAIERTEEKRKQKSRKAA